MTAQRRLPVGHEGLEHRFAVRASRMRVGRDYCLIAGEFLIVAETCRRQLHQRVEPEQAADDGRREICEMIAATSMQPFVRKHQTSFVIVVAQIKVAGQHDPRTHHAKQCGQTVAHLGQPEVIAQRLQFAERDFETALLPPQPPHHPHHAAKPGDEPP